MFIYQRAVVYDGISVEIQLGFQLLHGIITIMAE